MKVETGRNSASREIHIKQILYAHYTLMPLPLSHTMSKQSKYVIISLLLMTLSVVGILGLAGAAAPSAGVELVVGLVDMVPGGASPCSN